MTIRFSILILKIIAIALFFLCVYQFAQLNHLV